MTQMKYTYYFRNRPPSIGTHPKGAIEVVSWMPKQETPTGNLAFGYVAYSDPLSTEEIQNYELFEDKPEMPKYIQEIVKYVHEYGVTDAMETISGSKSYRDALINWMKRNRRYAANVPLKDQMRKELERYSKDIPKQIPEPVEESTPETDPNYALKKALKREQDARWATYPTVQEFRDARNKQADLLQSDFHLKSYKDKAEKYKPGTIQFNKHMAKYNERLQEIADLRTEAETGKTLRELELEETIRKETEQFAEEERGKKAKLQKEEQLRKMSSDVLKQAAFDANISWTDDSLSWKERHAAKDEGRTVLKILKERGVDITEKLPKHTAATATKLKQEVEAGETVEVPESTLKAIVESEPSSAVKEWMKIAHGIEDYKGGRTDRRSMLGYIINYYTLGEVRNSDEAHDIALALGKDLGYGTPPGTGISWERYYAEQIANETGKDVSIIQNAVVVQPKGKSVERLPDGSYKEVPLPEKSAELESKGRSKSVEEPKIKDTGDPVLDKLLHSIKGSLTTTKENIYGEKVTYPKRKDMINYAGTVYTFLLKGGIEPKAPDYFTYEEERTLWKKAVEAAKRTRSLQKKEVPKIKKAVSSGKTVEVPELVLQPAIIKSVPTNFDPVLKKESAITIGNKLKRDIQQGKSVQVPESVLKPAFDPVSAPMLLYPGQTMPVAKHVTELKAGNTITIPSGELKLLMSPSMARYHKRLKGCKPPVHVKEHCRRGCVVRVKPYVRACPAHGAKGKKR